jgi:ATP-binding cassette subfamily B protein/subfamily B ATP-binding cassette protein MsbA
MAYRLPRTIAGARRGLLVRLVFNGMLQALATLAAARLVHDIFDTLVIQRAASGDDRIMHVALVGMGLLGSAALLAWLRTVERSDAERMGQGYVTELRVTLFDLLSALSLRGLQRRSRGGVVLRFVGDLKMLRLWVSLGLSRILVAAVSTVVALGALAYADPALAAAAGVAIGLGLGTLLALGQRTQVAMREARRRQGYLSANVNEKVASIAVVQAFGQARRERGHLLRQSERLRDAMVEQARRAAILRSMGDFTAAGASAAVLLTGALEVAAGTTSVATVVAAMTVVGMLVPGLRDLGLAFGYWNGAQVAQRKLEEFLASPATVAEASGAPAIAAGGGSVEFRAVEVAGSLRGFSAVAQPGKVTAIVGPNGGGKSTLLAVAARLMDPDAGQVLLDGQDIAAHSLRSVQRSFGMVSADLPLLRGSIERNLKYRWPKADDEALAQVRALCGIDEMIAALPDGIQTRVAEGGTNLSFGQRQRIALARALLGHPPVLLLDEADANLDGTSTKVLERILAHYEGTVLLVTHRLESAAAADHLWYVDNGQLIESGSPHELLHAPGPTARLFRTHLSLAAG